MVNHDVGYALPSEAFCNDELESIARAVARRAGCQIPSDAFDDCIQEARLLLWRKDIEVAALAPAARRVYLARCVWNLLRSCVRRERCERLDARSLEEVEIRPAVEPAEPRWRDAASRAAGSLPESVGSERLLAALAGLTPHAQALLDLYFFHDLTDTEIARRLGRTLILGQYSLCLDRLEGRLPAADHRVQPL